MTPASVRPVDSPFLLCWSQGTPGKPVRQPLPTEQALQSIQNLLGAQAFQKGEQPRAWSRSLPRGFSLSLRLAKLKQFVSLINSSVTALKKGRHTNVRCSQIAGGAASRMASPLLFPRWTSSLLLPEPEAMQPASPQLSADVEALQNPAAIPMHQTFSNQRRGKGGCQAVVLQLPGYFSPAHEKHVLNGSARLCLSGVIQVDLEKQHCHEQVSN